MRMKSRTAIVTGAASGIGRAVALELVKSGLNVCLFDRCKQGLSQTEDVIRSQHVTRICGDVSSSRDVARLFDHVHECFQKPAHVLVNSAGITRDGWIWDMEDTQWREVLEVNLTGSFLCIREFAQQYIKADGSNKEGSHEGKDKSIINISSIVRLSICCLLLIPM